MRPSRGRGAAACVVLVLGALVPALSAKALLPQRLTLRIVVTGPGAVKGPGARACSGLCAWRFRRGAVVRLSASSFPGAHFSEWTGNCSGHAACTVRLNGPRTVRARFAPDEGLHSWNPHVDCIPALATLPQILGSQESALRGATEAGGGFQPHLRGDADRRLLDPPCTLAGTPTYVEVHDVVVATTPKQSRDGDIVANLTDPNRPDIASASMKTLHAEIDFTWQAAHIAPPAFPPLGTHIDVQGFVYWDPAHVNEAFHSFSGWELHAFAAWRPAASPASG